MKKYKVSYWTIVEAENEEEAKEGFSENIDDYNALLEVSNGY